MHKRLHIVILVIVILVVLIVSIIFLSQFNKSNETMKYSYHVKITPSKQGKYTAFIPVPENEDGSVSKMIENVKIVYGNVSMFKLEKTNHGNALNITGKGAIQMSLEGGTILPDKQKSVSEVYLSMYNSSSRYIQEDTPIWIFLKSSDGGNATISLTFSYSHYVGPKAAFWNDTHITAMINDGWNLVPATTDVTVA